MITAFYPLIYGFSYSSVVTFNLYLILVFIQLPYSYGITRCK